MKNNKLWFRTKEMGWGWYPASWQGWVVMGLFVAYIGIIISAVSTYFPTRGGVAFAIVGVAVGLLLAIKISLVKGEIPHWASKKK